MDFDFYTKEEINAMLGGLSFEKISQADFDALTTKDPNKVYFVYDENGNVTQYIGDAALSSGNAPVSASLLAATVGTPLLAGAALGGNGYRYSQDSNNGTKTTTTQSLYVDSNSYLIAAVMYRGDSVTIDGDGWTEVADAATAVSGSINQHIKVFGKAVSAGTYTVTVTQNTSVRMGLKLIALVGATGVSTVSTETIASFPYTAPATTGKRRVYLGSSITAATSGTEPVITTSDGNLATMLEQRFSAFYDNRNASGNVSTFLQGAFTGYDANTANFITLDINGG